VLWTAACAEELNAEARQREVEGGRVGGASKGKENFPFSKRHTKGVVGIA
jgi:hypothetical protein